MKTAQGASQTRPRECSVGAPSPKKTAEGALSERSLAEKTAEGALGERALAQKPAEGVLILGIWFAFSARES